MKSNVRNISLVVVGACILTAVFLTARQVMTIAQLAKRTNYNVSPFERHLPQAKLRFLFLGDSTAVGTGAAEPSLSTSGYFGRDFPDADIENISRNGKKIHELLLELKDRKLAQYDLIVIQIGGNDIMKFTPIDRLQEDLIALLRHVVKYGRHVVILHSGNVGIAPIFQWPFDVILAERSKKVRTVYMRQAKNWDVVYIDLFTERSTDLFLTDIGRYYSGDLLHPSGDGYRFWYQRIRESLNEAGVILN